MKNTFKTSQINNACAQCEPETNRFIEQYKWTIGVWITVQIGERGKFTDMQIGERGKQLMPRSKDYLRSYNSMGVDLTIKAL